MDRSAPAIKAARGKVPKFATEAEEAKWWDDHREMIERNLIRAIDNGTVQHGIARRLVREARASRNITIRMAETDLSLTRKQAQEEGRPYQTYIKSVLHEALIKQERRRANRRSRRRAIPAPTHRKYSC